MYLHPVEPLILRPAAADALCIDRATENERYEELTHGPERGLRALIQHPRTPVNVDTGISEGIWAPLGQCGVYLHREIFFLEESVGRSRWSVIASIDPDCSPLKSVVHVLPQSIPLLMESLEKASVDPVGVTALFRDENHYLEQLIEAREGIEPFLTIGETPRGLHHLWVLSEQEGQAVLALLERCGSALVSDVALYRAILKLRNKNGFASRIRPVVHFYHQRDFGVSFVSTARLYPHFDGFDVNRFLASLHQSYEVREVPIRHDEGAVGAYREFFDGVRTEGITRRVIGVLVRGLNVGFQVLAAEGDTPPCGENPIGEAALEFDATWVQHGIVEPSFPREAQAPVCVLPEPRLAPAALEDGVGHVAFVVNPPPKRFIPRLLEADWRLPAGSLQLRPPVPRGLLLCPLPQPACSRRT